MECEMHMDELITWSREVSRHALTMAGGHMNVSDAMTTKSGNS